MREGGDYLEQHGMTLARLAGDEADLCLWLLDASSQPIWPGFQSNNMQFLINKADLPAAWDMQKSPGALPISARTGMGLGELCQIISRKLVRNPPPPGAAVPFTQEMCEAILFALPHYYLGSRVEAKQLLVKAWTKLGANSN
jgi:tRNA U34 5-carboxymethylaminomethyl modifying GTPase MnmE/TrmE